MASTAATRKRLRIATPQSDAAEMTAEVVTLQAVIREIREMREEHARREHEYSERFRRQEEELRRLRGTNSGDNPQLSSLNNRVPGDLRARDASGAEMSGAYTGERTAVTSGAETRVTYAGGTAAVASGAARVTGAGVDASGDGISRGIKLKPDTYDGTAPLREFLSQFKLIAVANRWSEAEKAVVLASSLRGKARSLLDSFADGIESLSYAELKAKLELRFGESELAQNYYLQFTNRKQRPGEDFAALGADLERLSQKAYPECSHEVRDKIASSQFVAALTDGFVKRTLQVEGVTSLRIAIERSKMLKFINQNCFSGKRDATPGDFHSGQKEVPETKKFTKGQKGNERRKTKECWGCGATGHFRSECPAQRQEN